MNKTNIMFKLKAEYFIVNDKDSNYYKTIVGYIVQMNTPIGWMDVKRFKTDDSDYNKICAEELLEKLNERL